MKADCAPDLRTAKRGRPRLHSAEPVFLFYLVEMERAFRKVGLNRACQILDADYRDQLGRIVHWQTIKRQYVAAAKMLKDLPDADASKERGMAELRGRRDLCGYSGLLDGLKFLGIPTADLVKALTDKAAKELS